MGKGRKCWESRQGHWKGKWKINEAKHCVTCASQLCSEEMCTVHCTVFCSPGNRYMFAEHLNRREPDPEQWYKKCDACNYQVFCSCCSFILLANKYSGFTVYLMHSSKHFAWRKWFSPKSSPRWKQYYYFIAEESETKEDHVTCLKSQSGLQECNLGYAPNGFAELGYQQLT